MYIIIICVYVYIINIICDWENKWNMNKHNFFIPRTCREFNIGNYKCDNYSCKQKIRQQRAKQSQATTMCVLFLQQSELNLSWVGSDAWTKQRRKDLLSAMHYRSTYTCSQTNRNLIRTRMKAHTHTHRDWDCDTSLINHFWQGVDFVIGLQ